MISSGIHIILKQYNLDPLAILSRGVRILWMGQMCVCIAVYRVKTDKEVDRNAFMYIRSTTGVDLRF